MFVPAKTELSAIQLSVNLGFFAEVHIWCITCGIVIGVMPWSPVPLVRRLEGPRAGLNSVVKRKIYVQARNRNAILLSSGP
jgi:hypothetical protein